MINLIPPQAKRAITKEYWLRVAVVWLLLVGTALACVAVMKIPAYALINAQANALEQEFAAGAVGRAESQSSEDAIKLANTQARHLADVSSSTPFSVFIRELDQLSGGGVEISNFDMGRDDGVVSRITVSGIADRRSDLTRFNDVIEAHPLFVEAELPISNLAKDREIKFSISVTPREATN